MKRSDFIALISVMALTVLGQVHADQKTDHQGGHAAHKQTDQMHQEHAMHGEDAQHQAMQPTGQGAIASDYVAKFAGQAEGKQVLVANVEGMVCDFCARGVEKTFQKQVAVRDIQVDLAKGVILLAYDSGYTIDKQAVARGVLDNGLNLVGVEVLEF